MKKQQVPSTVFALGAVVIGCVSVRRVQIAGLLWAILAVDKVGLSHALFNVVSAFVEAHPEFLREQEEIERLDGKDGLSEAVARLGTHAPAGAGVVDHGTLGRGAEEEGRESEEEREHDVSEVVGRRRAIRGCGKAASK